MKNFFFIKDTTDNIPLSCREIQDSFSAMHSETINRRNQKTQNLNTVIRQRNLGIKTKLVPKKPISPFQGNKTLLRYFRKLNKISKNNNTETLENHYTDTKKPSLPLLILI